MPGTTFVLYAAVFRAVPGLRPIVEGASLRASPASPLPPGTCTVQWKAVTADGGVTQGNYPFRIVASFAPGSGTGFLLLALAASGAVFWWSARCGQNRPGWQ